jgi:glycosyltransferase involved in cell wall biosynthesis
MKISIVTAYHNRKNLLINTLKSISKSKHNDFEVIVVDDASSEEHRVEDLLKEYSFMKLIRLEPENKWYVNSCIPFNIGFKETSGDIVILQNPECFHTDDIISYTANNLNEDDYFAFGCYSLDENKTKIISDNTENYKDFNFNLRGAAFNGDDAWYNHSIYRNVGYHFTSAIYKKKLDELGGFDERYAKGIEYDDNEFLHRVKKICNVRIVDEPLVFHQYHGDSSKRPNFMELSNMNKDLYHNYTLRENIIKVNL